MSSSATKVRGRPLSLDDVQSEVNSKYNFSGIGHLKDRMDSVMVGTYFYS